MVQTKCFEVFNEKISHRTRVLATFSVIEIVVLDWWLIQPGIYSSTGEIYCGGKDKGGEE